MKLSPIPTTTTLTQRRAAEWLARGDSPLILTQAMSSWPAMSRWSFDYFATHFGEFPVVAHAPQFPDLAQWGVKTTLAHYLDYLRNPTTGMVEGQWTEGDAATLAASGLTLYAGNFNPAHPVRGNPARIFADVPERPKFIESWLDLLDPDFLQTALHAQSHHFVYLSTAGGVTPLHHDFWGTHAFLAQVVGRKRAVLFHPRDMDLLYEEPSGDVPKMMRDPRFADIDGWEGELGPGDLLLMPSKFLHWVETLSPSITYSADWIDGCNWKIYVEEGTKALADRGLWS